MRMHRQDATDQGFIIDDYCYPPLAYKGSRFAPSEHHSTYTPLEGKLLTSLSGMHIILQAVETAMEDHEHG